MRILKSEFRLSLELFAVMLLVQLGAFLFGVILAAVIIHMSDADTTFPLGCLMSLVVTGFSAIFLYGMSWQPQFQTAIAMGRSRRSVVPIHILLSFLQLLVGVALSLVLGIAEDALYARIYPSLESEMSLGMVLLRGWKYVLLGAVGVCVLGLFFAAVYGRFHRKGFFVVYFVGLFGFLFAQRVTNAVWANPDSILGRFGRAVARPFGNVAGGVWLGLGVLVAVILTALSLHWLLRQQVEL